MDLKRRSRGVNNKPSLAGSWKWGRSCRGLREGIWRCKPHKVRGFVARRTMLNNVNAPPRFQMSLQPSGEGRLFAGIIYRFVIPVRSEGIRLFIRWDYSTSITESEYLYLSAYLGFGDGVIFLSFSEMML